MAKIVNPGTPPVCATVTHSAVAGTTNGTLVDCTGTYSEAAVEENFKELAVKLNEVIAILQDAGFATQT